MRTGAEIESDDESSGYDSDAYDNNNQDEQRSFNRPETHDDSDESRLYSGSSPLGGLHPFTSSGARPSTTPGLRNATPLFSLGDLPVSLSAPTAKALGSPMRRLRRLRAGPEGWVGWEWAGPRVPAESIPPMRVPPKLGVAVLERSKVFMDQVCGWSCRAKAHTSGVYASQEL